jgi:MoaA/NifB/PqqE/SkfB family radical SAM enzyme
MSELAKRLSYIPYVAYRQAKWLLGDRSPFAATLKLTTRCSLKCRHCPWTNDPGDDLPTSRWIEIITELSDKGARHLVLEGGEPTLRDDLQELIAFGQSKNMKVTVASNFTHPLEKYTPDRFLVSVDGMEQIHDRLRGKGAFKRIIENLPTTKVPRIALVSLSQENVHQIKDILDFFTPRLDGFWFSFVYDYEGNEKIALTAEEKKRAGADILTLKKNYPIINLPSYLQQAGTPRKCNDWLLMTVTADGAIHPGCMIEAVEPCRCDECELACHREFSDFVEPRLFPHHLLNYLKGL